MTPRRPVTPCSTTRPGHPSRPRRRRGLRAASGLWLGLAAAAPPTPVSGQDTPPSGPDERRFDLAEPGGGLPGARIETGFGGRYLFDSGLGDVDLTVVRSGVAVSASGPIPDAADLGYQVNLLYENSYYDFDRLSAEVGGGAIDESFNASRLRLSPGLSYLIGPDLVVFGGPTFDLSFEEGADASNATRFGGVLGAGYELRGNLSVTAGVAVQKGLEDDTEFLPILGVQWAIDDTLSLSVSGNGAGVEARVIKKLNDRFDVSGFISFEQRDYRLDDSRAGVLRGGVLRDDSVLVGGEIGWRPRPDVLVAFEAGAGVAQTIEFESTARNRITEQDDGFAPFIGLTLRLEF